MPGGPRHALGHTGLIQLLVECPVGVLESPVAVEQGMDARICLGRLVKGLESQKHLRAISAFSAAVFPFPDRIKAPTVRTAFSFSVSHSGSISTA